MMAATAATAMIELMMVATTFALARYMARITWEEAVARWGATAAQVVAATAVLLTEATSPAGAASTA